MNSFSSHSRTCRAFVALTVTLLGVSACSKAATAITTPEDAGLLSVNSQVYALMFARTQQTAVALTANQLRVLALTDGRELRTIDYGNRPVTTMAYSPDGAAVALGDRTGLVSVWDAATGQLRFDHRLSGYPGLLAFSADGQRLAVTARNDGAQILDAGSGRLVMTLASQVGGTSTLAFSPDGRWVATGDGDTIVRIHDAATGQEVARNREFLLVPLALTFSADSKSVLAVSGDNVVTRIDVATGITAQSSIAHQNRSGGSMSRRTASSSSRFRGRRKISLSPIALSYARSIRASRKWNGR